MNANRVIPVRQRTIVDMSRFKMGAINELGIEPEDIAESAKHKFSFGNISLRQI
jgi:hypothetical protein